MTPPRRSLPRAAAAILKAALAAGLVLYLVRSGRFTWKGVSALFSAAHVPVVLASLGLFFLSQALMGFRLRWLLLASGMDLPWRTCFRLTMIGNAFNMLIPGTVGGDLVKTHWLMTSPSPHRGRSPGVIVMDRLMGLMALIAVCCASGLYLGARLEAARAGHGGALAALLAAVALLVGCFALLLAAARSPKARAALKRALSAVSSSSLVHDAAAGLGHVGRAGRTLAKVFFLGAGIHALNLAALVVLSGVIPGPLPARLDMAAISALIFLAGAVPVTPGNVGWGEFLAMLGWASIGSDAGAAVFLNWRILTCLGVLPWGLLYIARGKASAGPAAHIL